MVDRKCGQSKKEKKKKKGQKKKSFLQPTVLTIHFAYTHISILIEPGC